MPLGEILGHHHLHALLARAVTRDTLPPALLFAGPAGVGKRRTALALAQVLNCLTAVTPEGLERDACGDCNACRRIARGVHPDVLMILPGESGAIKIEQVRDAIDRSNYRPFEGRRRVVIVDDAEALVPAAQHALLKTLEEPPSTAVFVLVAAVPDSLLATVRSRCSRLRFGRLTATDVAAVLVRDHGIDDSDARVTAADAEGSVGRALALEVGDLTAARTAARQLLEQVARVSEPSRRIAGVKELWGKKRTAAEERAQLAACLRVVSSMLRDLCALDSGVPESGLSNADLRGELERLASSYDSDRTIRAFGVVDQALGALQRNASPKVVANWLAVHL
jgi:DNA polymerase-3 subunit delta'